MNQRRALCIGLNYPGTSAELRGCVNDALDWQQALDARGYATTVLFDGQGTRDGILDSIAELVARTGYRDRLVITYSGHGSWVPDRNGDEADSRDEAVVPADYRTAGVITDDELHAVFTQRRFGARITFLSDSCHSGTLARFADLTADSRPRYMPPINAVPDLDIHRAHQAEHKPARGKPRTGVVLISGCTDAEYSYDASFNGRPNGAFTRAALDVLDAGSTIAEWHEDIRRVRPNERYPQTPQLTATWTQRRWRALD